MRERAGPGCLRARPLEAGDCTVGDVPIAVVLGHLAGQVVHEVVDLPTSRLFATGHASVTLGEVVTERLRLAVDPVVPLVVLVVSLDVASRHTPPSDDGPGRSGVQNALAGQIPASATAGEL